MRKINIILIFVLIFMSATVFLKSYTKENEAAACVPVLLYHNIVPVIENEDVLLNITPEQFGLHMKAIKNAGFNTITYRQFYDFAFNGGSLPENPIIVTFDDGYKSNYTYAYPVLKELGMRATIFIVTSTVGATENVNYPHFSWEEASEMEKSGVMEIQSHSHSHKDMADMDYADAVREIRLSKYLIETNLGKTCDFFAYPYGGYNDFTFNAAQQAGYLLQSKVGNQGSNTKDTPPDPMKRLTVCGDMTAEDVIQMIESNLGL